jgi:hypothetical protein
VTFYTELAAVVVDLLTPDQAGGLGASAGAITLTRQTVTPGANRWDDPVITSTTEPLRAQAFGVSQQLVGTPAQEPDGPVVLASDRMVISTIPAMGYQAGDILSIDGVAQTIIGVRNIPAAGVVSAVKFIVRG